MDESALSSGEEEIDAAYSLMQVYKSCVDKYGWSLKEIDETDLDTLFEFLVMKDKPDPNVRVIDGKNYLRASKVPDWL